MQWYYSTDGGAHTGPVDDAELRQLARSGAITPESLLWNETLGDQWQPASSFGFLFFHPVDLQPPAIPAVTDSDSIPPRDGTTPNRDLMRLARESLTGRWGIAILATVIYVAVIFLFVGLILAVQLPETLHAQQAQMKAIIAAQQAHQSITPLPSLRVVLPLKTRLIVYSLLLLQYIITAPLVVGLLAFFLKIARGSVAEISDIFKGFSIFWKSVGTYFLMIIFILLWALLLIVPGIIAMYSYSLALFILADDPTISPLQALEKSKTMMKGKRWKLFCLCLRFFGWSLLALLTCGIGWLWLLPYMETAMSHFYLDVKDRATVS